MHARALPGAPGSFGFTFLAEPRRTPHTGTEAALGPHPPPELAEFPRCSLMIRKPAQRRLYHLGPHAAAREFEREREPGVGLATTSHEVSVAIYQSLRAAALRTRRAEHDALLRAQPRVHGCAHSATPDRTQPRAVAEDTVT